MSCARVAPPSTPARLERRQPRSLTSHTALTQAIRLYELLGLRHALLPADVRHASANVYMTLSLR